MNLYQLRYFSLLARTGHFRRTAEQLCITQPSLSHSIALLERELGVTLFERQGRRSVLTPEGKSFLSYVQRSLDILDEGVSRMEQLAKGEGLIELGFLRTLGTDLVPAMARGFLDANGGGSVRFEFHTGITSALLRGLREEAYDLVFCTKLESETDIEFVPVSRQDLVVIVPLGHPLSDRSSLSLTELLPYPQVFFAPQSGLRTVIDGLFRKIQGSPRIAYEIEEDIVIAGLVAKGFGVAVVPYMPDLLHMDVKLLQISYPSWERNFYMATVKGRHLTPAAANFRSYVLDRYARAMET
ncbi:MAG: LysR family transcriptional regulator [Eubacteriales bacterium]|nr:LysR family transcriptional regulator [Eubacteriales bacterium]